VVEFKYKFGIVADKLKNGADLEELLDLVRECVGFVEGLRPEYRKKLGESIDKLIDSINSPQ
jgi:crotonobetainyl-CoA:carnitine CoA-transferase CaiB-like acyl-CoA transferase